MELNDKNFIHNLVYVRDCYPKLIESILQTIIRALSPSNLMVVTGTPGMGKTTFLGYCYDFLKSMNVKVIAKHSITKCVLYNGAEEVVLNDVKLETLIGDGERYEYIFLVDASSGWIPAPLVSIIVVLFSSPSIKNKGHFSRNNSTYFLMPPWDKEELYMCLQRTQPKLYRDEDRFNVAYDRWGGSINLHIMESSAQARFEEFLCSPELDMMVEMVSTVELSTIVPTDLKVEYYQAFLFRFPDGRRLRFPSNQLATEAVAKYAKRKPELLMGLQGTMLGLAYEELVFRLLLCEDSTSLPCKNKNGVTTQLPVVQKVSKVSFFNSVTTPNVRGVLYRPTSSTNKGFDCILENFVFQITTNATHPKMDLSALDELIPIHRVKVVMITLTRNKRHFKIPIIKYGDKQVLKDDVYVYYFDFSTPAQIAIQSS